MDHVAELVRAVDEAVEHFDVLIIGAGISGIGSAYHLTKQCPDMQFVILEEKDTFGGTWATHQYPGIRSDSDLHTFGYRFKPWKGVPIATGAEILSYLGEVIEENDLRQYIRYRQRVLRAAWDSASGLWTIDGEHADTGVPLRIRAGFLWMCQGYYRHDGGYTPEWEGVGEYRGLIVHPMTWPEDLDYAGKQVLVIGSGATAATIIPAMAADSAHITMLQRSPTYYMPGRNAIALAEELRELQVDEAWIHEIVRRRILVDQRKFTRRAFEEPEKVRAELLAMARAHLGEDYDIETHFSPRYRPWQQRLAFIPNGDLFKAIASGKVSVVTDEIERFSERSVLLKSGQELEADIIITATGFHLSALGDIRFVVDGSELNFAETVTWRGMMFTGLPNCVWVFGYFRASWTLRVDLVADFVCRLLRHMRAKGARKVEVELRADDADMVILPWIDEEDFNPGYMKRGAHLLPKRGDKPEWAHTQDYWMEKDAIPATDLDDAVFRYG
ncbi:MAG: NAD(P)/FAD-dependent oxidoreductase [Acetobacteraceae bacterium]|nr:NAD(P)/FAD-dependent oxidoreductase [Acetobacteraceae bacterium]